MFLYRARNSSLVKRCLVRLYLICGSGKVIQISSTSLLAKQFSINSICVRKKTTLGRFSSIAVFAPRQKREPLISIPIKFVSGKRRANSTEYSPLPQPNSKTIGWVFLNTSLFQFPFKEKLSLITLSLEG